MKFLIRCFATISCARARCLPHTRPRQFIEYITRRNLVAEQISPSCIFCRSRRRIENIKLTSER